jgi:hypothetical protein
MPPIRPQPNRVCIIALVTSPGKPPKTAMMHESVPIY